MSYKLLIINPGSTSTKIGVYEDETPILVETIRHTAEELAPYNLIYEQFHFRKDLILDVLKQQKIDINTLDAIIGRGGLLKPIEGGTYSINEKMLEDLKTGYQGQHASNLGGVLAYAIASEANLPSFIVDPVVVDELEDIARISGFPELPRVSIFHALNQKAVAKRFAKERNKNYQDINLIVAHLGGGISVGAHKNGRIIEVNNTLDGEGPFSPERAGSVPVGALARMCFSGEYTLDEIKKKINGKGGVVAHLNTNDVKAVDDAAVAGDKKAELIRNAMAYQVAKDIGKCAAVLSGKVDAIILTGGVAYSKNIVKYITERVSFISEVVVYAGEDELLALAQGGISVLSGEEMSKDYI